MSIKDLFKSGESFKFSSPKSTDDVAREVGESSKFIEQHEKDRDRFIPPVDYSRPVNFARYGLAEKYYEDSITRIYNSYPYDGSLREKLEWHNSSSYIDKYIFENKYPRTNGYIRHSSGEWGAEPASLIDGYGLPPADRIEYIQVKGGPHTGSLVGGGMDKLKTGFTGSNIYDTASRRESNLGFDLSKGTTVEFWLKKLAFNEKQTEKEVIFDLWNGQASSSVEGSGYGRFVVEMDGFTSATPFIVTAQSGSSGSFKVPIGEGITTTTLTNWNHYALAVASEGNNLVTKLYVNGELNHTVISGSSFGKVTGSMIANIGALRTAHSASQRTDLAITEGHGKLSASLDEFRYWKTERSAENIGRYWFTQIHGGTNTDEAKYDSENPVDLGVYFKFNEGITGTSSIDTTVLDYSGRFSNGNWIGDYNSESRNIGSAMVSASAAKGEFKDPIIYSSHSEVKDLLKGMRNSGSAHDVRNNAALYNMLPRWVIDDDAKSHGNIKNLTQIIASYLDTLHLQVEALPRIREATYSTYMSASVSSSAKPLPFANRLLEGLGLDAPELFIDAEIIEKLTSRDEKRDYQEKLHDVKNLIYHNIYNNLTYIYKSKGTEKSFRNLVRCFGIDDELIKFNIYGQNAIHEFKDNFRSTVIRKNMVDFNNPARFGGTVYQAPSGSERGYITGSHALRVIPSTVEAEIVFPKKRLRNDINYFDTPFLTSSLFGMHGVRDTANAGADTTWSKWIKATAVDCIDTTDLLADRYNDASFTILIPTRAGGLGGTAITFLLDASESTSGAGDANQIMIGVDDGITDAARAALIVKAINAVAHSKVNYATSGNGQPGYDIGVTAAISSTSDTQITLTMDKAGHTGNIANAITTVSGVDIIDERSFTGADPGGAANFQVFAIRSSSLDADLNTRDAYFMLTSSSPYPFEALTSSVFPDVYDDKKWNFAVRLKHDEHPWVERGTGSFGPPTGTEKDTYTVEFYGANTVLDEVASEFMVTASVSASAPKVALANTFGEYFVKDNRRLYCGAHRTNFTGSVLQKTDVKASSLRYWLNYLDNDTIKAHAKDSTNYGVKDPYRNLSMFHDQITGSYIPEIETLALHWDFEKLTGSDGGGGFELVEDFSSGSLLLSERYGSLGSVTKRRHPGSGAFFPLNSTASINRDYIQVAKQQLPEMIYSNDMVSIVKEDDVTFERSSQPTQFFFAAEKSMYQTISEEMINMFASVVNFNNLIGEPVNRYRQNYKDLTKLRQLFFESIDNTADLDKYVDFYKWIDHSITSILQQLMPASANISENLRTMIESHVLERNKYQTKYPTMDAGMRLPMRLGAEAGYTSLGGADQWQFGHATLPSSLPKETVNCLWWLYRADRSEPSITSGDAMVDRARNKILSASSPAFNRSPKKGVSSNRGSVYRFGYDLDGPIHGGANVNPNKNHEYIRQNTSFGLTQQIAAASFTDLLIIPDDLADDDRFTVNVPTAAGGAGYDITIRIVADADDGTTNEAQVTRTGTENTRNRLVLLINGLSSTVVKYGAGSGDVTNGIAGITAANGTGTSQITITATKPGVAGNQIVFTDVEGTIVEAGDSSSPAKLTGGKTDPPLLNAIAAADVGKISDCEDRPIPDELVKTKYNFKIDKAGDKDGYTSAKGEFFAPFSMHNSSLESAATAIDCIDTTGLLANRYNDASFTILISAAAGGLGGTAITFLLDASESTSGTGDANQIMIGVDDGITDAARAALIIKAINAVTDSKVNYATSGNGQAGYDIGVTAAEGSSNTQITLTMDTAGSDGNITSAIASVSGVNIIDVTAFAHGARDGGYIQTISNDFLSFVDFTNMHQDITYIGGEIPMQGPFTEKYVGGQQYRHVDINKYDHAKSTTNKLDDRTTRPEGWFLELADGKVSIVGPDYHSNAYFRATYIRQEHAKRPVNIRNIRTTGSTIGNYSSSFEYVSTVGRTQNNAYFKENEGVSLPTKYAVKLPKTTHIHSLVGVTVGVAATFVNVLTIPGDAANNDRFTVNVPSSIGGAGTNITVRLVSGDPSDGTANEVQVGMAATATTAARLVAAINGLSSTVVKYGAGSGDVTNGIAGISAVIGTSPKMTITATTFGATGNEIVFTDVEGTMVEAGDSSSPAKLTGGGGSDGNIFGANPKSLTDLSNRFSTRTTQPLPRRDLTGSDSVIVSRFSAPGGPEINSRGYLDIAAEEYSVYNALPFRNLSVRGSGSGEKGTIRVSSRGSSAEPRVRDREGLRTRLTRHCGQFGFDSQWGSTTAADYSSTGSFHKVHRNTRKRIEYSNAFIGNKGVTVTASFFNNAWVTTPIPASDLQYSWLTASFSSLQSTAEVYGYAPADGMVSSSTQGTVPAYNFVSASHVINSNGIVVSFAGYNTIVVDGVISDQNLLSASFPSGYVNNDLGTIDSLAATAVNCIDTTGLLADRYNDASFTILVPTAAGGLGGTAITFLLDASQSTSGTGGANQIMIGTDDGITDAARAALIIKAINAVTDSKVNYATSGNGQAGYDIGVTAVEGSSDTQITLTMDTAGKAGNITSALASVSGVNIIVVTAFAGGVSNVEIANAITLQRNGPYQYPSWKQIRTGENAVARHQRKNNVISINKSPAKVFGFSPIDRPAIPLKGGKLRQFTEAPVVSKHKPIIHILESKNYSDLDMVEVDSEIPLIDVGFKYTYANNKAMFSNSELNFLLNLKNTSRQIYDELVDLYINPHMSDGEAPITSRSFKSLLYTETIWPKAVNTFLAKTRGRIQYTETTGSESRGYDRGPNERRTFWRDKPADRIGTNADLKNAMGIRQGISVAGGVDYVRHSGRTYQSGALSFWPLDGTRPNYLSLGQEDNFSKHYKYKEPNAANDYFGELFSPVFTSFVNAVKQYQAAQETDLDLALQPIATSSLQYLYPTIVPQSGTSFDGPFADGRFSGSAWYAPAKAEKNPWFDSYEDYSDDIRRIAKDYSVIPEFRISDHMEDYLSDPNGFMKDTPGFLSLDGASITSSLDSDFYKIYSYSDFLKHFEVIEEEHIDIASQKQITLRCKGIKKLLPYNGFYPVTRTVQLGTLFSQSIGPYLTSSVVFFHSQSAAGPNSNRNYMSESQLRMQCMLEPFFAPGILYNTIKSGIAVDYPIFSGSLPIAASGSSVGGEAQGFQPFRLRIYQTGSATQPAAATSKVPNFVWTGSSDYMYRLPFESLIDLREFPIDADVYMTHPIVQWLFSQGTLSERAGNPNNPRVRWVGQNDKKYPLAMNNFLAEVPNFFLEKKGFTTFYSETENKFKEMDKNKTYYMDVSLYKTDGFVMAEGTTKTKFVVKGALSNIDNAETAIITDKIHPATRSVDRRGRIYGPNFIAMSSSVSENAYHTDSGSWHTYTADPGYAPYTPPYFYGKSKVTLSFKPYDGSRKYFLDEIMSRITASYTNAAFTSAGVTSSFSSSYGVNVKDSWEKTPAGEQIMHISSSVNLFGKTFGKVVEYDADGEIKSVREPEDPSSHGLWTIGTKFETPILNFPEETDYPQSIYTRGMWMGYGQIPASSEGVFMSVEESYPEIINTSTNATTGSLIDVCGFSGARKGCGFRQKLGVVATEREISEAIVAVPIIVRSGKTKFFSVPREQINDAMDIPRTKKGRSIEEVPEAGRSVRDMVRKMENYVFPPRMDFTRNADIEPFAMYIFEFTHTLSRQDLADIWQNLMPEISTTAQEQEVAVSHPIANNEFFGEAGLPKNVRFMVFKVKKKAKDNYFEVTEDSSDDDRFKFNLSIGGKTTECGMYSYNWPYDYFSLVELAKIDATATLGKKEEDS